MMILNLPTFPQHSYKTITSHGLKKLLTCKNKRNVTAGRFFLDVEPVVIPFMRSDSSIYSSARIRIAL